MTFRKSGLIVPAVAIAAVAGVAAAAYSSLGSTAKLDKTVGAAAVVVPAAAPGEPTQPLRVAKGSSNGVQVDAPGTTVDTAGRNVRVRAPHTDVDVDKERGKVRVKAPYTDVRVDPDKGQVRVRAPYVDLNIRW